MIQCSQSAKEMHLAIFSQRLGAKIFERAAEAPFRSVCGIIIS